MRKDIFDRQEEIEKWVSEMRSKASICLELKCRPATLDSYLKNSDCLIMAIWEAKVKSLLYEKKRLNFCLKEVLSAVIS